ncbi:MAG: hypothetical protein OEW58_12340 [Gammaproteobacteria bacterium]|nr:hypothetical protein [Gammaproteobacteria bacterium]
MSVVDYSKWKSRELKITNLKLDAFNPRLPEAEGGLSQRKLIEELILHESVYELAKDIADKGYYPIESLIVVEEDGKKIVVEGNRRLAALKLLHNPDLAPDKFRKKFSILSDRSPNVIKVVVLVALSREAAAPLIMNKHTSSQVKGWSPVMQAKFYVQLIKSGKTISDISEEYSVPKGDIKEFLQRYEMYSVACKLDLPEEILDIVTDPRRFNVTTLERLYTHRDIQKILGIEFDEDKKLKGNISSDEFKKGFSKIVSDVALGKETSRTVNDDDGVKRYIGEFASSDLPDLKSKGVFTGDDLLSGEEEKLPAPSPEKKKVVSKVSRKSKSLLPSYIKCQVNNKRIVDIFSEMKKISVADQPNTSAVMFRVILEMSISHYLEKTRKIEEVLNGKGKSKDWAPTLKDMIKYILNEDKDIELGAGSRKAINKLLDKNEIFSIDTLDNYIHNRRLHPTEDKLRAFWEAIEELMIVVLTEPSYG